MSDAKSKEVVFPLFGCRMIVGPRKMAYCISEVATAQRE